ncbi:CDK5 regulatory subunit-associated protein 2 isoform X3 [Coregonus clupeaformis]|uniref:CDK5 regulatory subunit-associated protein 2 isoform X3 n=1 Tax=Coregonus clupeaformis TaxID=59861 RepID=UPI001E1C74F0|nr:CDK5 regulatory subunit-associated protein 2 isoform X3 [Coregonus clupeaformis]
MKDPCRVCGVRLIGSQCRWIFNPSGKRQLQVILSHVLGRQVDRDPDGQASEFLCGKCVFKLERVVQCDVQIGRLQEEHAAQVQRLQQERENLKQCVAHVYGRHNPLPERPDVGEVSTVMTPLWRSSEGGSPDECGGGQLTSEGQRKEDGGEGDGRVRHSVSMDLLGGPGGPVGAAGRSSSAPRRVQSGGDPCPACPVKNPGLQSARLRSRSMMYLDLVYRKGTLSGSRLRSASLQSLNPDHPHQTEPLGPLSQRPCRESKISVREHSHSVDHATTITTRLQRGHSPAQPPISDLLLLLRSIPRNPIPGTPGSRIPVLWRRPRVGQPLSPGRSITPGARRKEAEWKSLQDVTEEFNDGYMPLRAEGFTEQLNEVSRLETAQRQLSEEMNQFRATNQNLSKTLEDIQNNNKALSGKLEETENQLSSEKKNALKRDKTIQGLTLVLKEKEKEIEELCHEIEDRDEALAKAREAAHKAQLQKYQGAEEHQSLLMEKQAELSQLQGEHHTKLLEAQKLQRSLGRREQELADLQQAKEQLDQELEELQQQKKKGDKALNEVQNQLKKLSGELGERESSLEQQYQEQLEQTKRRLQSHEITIQRLTTCLADKEQQLQEYMNMMRDMEQSRSPEESDTMLSKLRERLKEKEKALEQALDEKFAALEEKDNEIHQLHLSLREKERDLERLNNLLSHNEDTINSFDTLIKEKDVELQHLANTLKNLQRAKQDVEDNLNRACREKDSIISQLQLSLEGKTKDMEAMASALLSQSQSQAHDLAEQMGQRLKVAEAMLVDAVKARERLVADNESAVEGLLATISSKDQLLKESAEHYNRTLSERIQEIQELRRQLCTRQQQLASAEKLSSTATQEGYLEMAELRVLLTEKESIINKLLERGQERDQFLAELRQKEPAPSQVLELRQTIKVLQERLDEWEGDLSKRNNNEDSMEKVPLVKKTVVILKKELSQKTEALNKALKKQNELQMSLADLQLVLSELEGRIEGQAASIDSLTTTLETKDEIINDLHQRLGQRGDSQTREPQDQAAEAWVERSLPGLPQRERTIIGGDSQQEVLPLLADLQVEHRSLNRALRAEQQLYSSLVRTVKEQDSAQRLHALQMELTAVTLLRQQLEEGIRSNEELREDLEREIARAKLSGAGREGQGEGHVDPRELQSVRHQLEDAQRWNASLQARLGAIQNRGGGVGATNDTADTLGSFMADQTSYMSICVGEGEGLDHLSVEELRQKVMELQDYVSRLQAVNGDLQRTLSLAEGSDHNLSQSSSGKEQDLERRQEKRSLHSDRGHSDSGQDKGSQTDSGLGQVVDGRLNDGHQSDDVTVRSTLAQIQRGIWHPWSSKATSESQSQSSQQGEVERDRDWEQLRSLLSDCGALSVTHLREELQRLRSENVDLRGQLKEEKSTESKESADTSGDSGDGQGDLRKTVERLRSEAKGHREIIQLLKEQLERTEVVVDVETRSDSQSDMMVTMTREMEKLRLEQEGGAHGREKVLEGEERGKAQGDGHATQGNSHTQPAKGHSYRIARHGAGVKSRLPVPMRHNKTDAAGSTESVNQASDEVSDHLRGDVLHQLGLEHHHDQQTSDSDSHRSPRAVQYCRPGSNRSTTTGTIRQGLETEFLRAQAPTDAELLSQLELLHQECQDKEQLIDRLEVQMAEWDELQAQLREKDRLIRHYVEALQAAESTITYLTACNLDSNSQGGVLGSGSPGSEFKLQRQCIELQNALEEKERLNTQLVECLNMVEAAIASLRATSSSTNALDGHLDPQELCTRLEAALRQVSASLDPLVLKTSAPGPSGDPLGLDAELQRQADSLQEVLWEQSRLNVELQERLRAAEEAVTAQQGIANTAPAGLEGNYGRQLEEDLNEFPRGNETKGQRGWGEHHGRSKMASDEKSSLGSEQVAKRLSECLRAAELAIASLTAHCTNTSTSTSTTTRAAQTSSDLQQQLDRLQRALQEREALVDLGSTEPTHQQTTTSTPNRHTTPGAVTPSSLELHHNICLLQKAFYDLQEGRGCRERESQTMEPGAWVPPRDVQAQLESLQKGLKERKRACKSLEEKLATAQSIIALQNSSKKTSHVATPRDMQLVPGSANSSLPCLLKQDQEEPSFSSTENLDTASSASYPSSPTLSSPKVSLKSLQTFDSYGVSEDPAQLKTQVRELKTQLESQHQVILHLQTMLRRRASLSSELLTATSDSHTATGGHTGSERGEEDGKEERSLEGEGEATKEKMKSMSMELERERSVNRSMSEQLLQAQQRSRSASPARIDSLVQSQARELSQLRRQIQESRGLGALHRLQLEELSQAFEELLQASDMDYYVGEVFREQLDKSLGVLERLEGRLEKGDAQLDNEAGAALELAQRLSKELQEKTRLVQSLQIQLRGQTPSSHHSSDSDLSDMVSNQATASYHNSPTLPACSKLHGNQSYHGMKKSNRGSTSAPDSAAQQTGGMAKDGGVSGHGGVSGRKGSAGQLQGLQRENGHLVEQLRSSEELNATLRRELDLHRSILVQESSTPLHTQGEGLGQSQGQAGRSPQNREDKRGEGHPASQQDTAQLRSMNPGLLAEHLLEIRALRQRLEETIYNNDRLREQLERRLGEVERDPAATNIFIHGTEEQGQLTSELRFLWGQNQALKEQLNLGSRDKQKENEKLREALARRTAKLEQSRKECEVLRQEHTCLQDRLDRSSVEHTHLQDTLHYSRQEIHRLQCEVKMQRQQLSDSQHLLQSLRLELQVYEKINTGTGAHTHTESSGTAQQSGPGSGSGSNQVDLGELLSEIRHLRLQLERSIQTNTSLRQRLEEQLLRGPNRPDTININYLLTTSEDTGRSPGREGCDPPRHSSHDLKRQAQSEMDALSQCSNSSGDSVSGSAPPLSRLVPGHRLWANRQGRHILGLIEDHNALRKQISEGRRLTRTMDTHLQECVRTLSQQGTDNRVVEQGQLKALSSSVNTMQQVLEEAGQLLKLVWRVSLPSGTATAGGDVNSNQQDELLKNEIASLKSRLSQQERMLSGAVKRLRTTNQLKEGMERVIIDQLSLTHGVLKKARGNLETNYYTVFGLKGLSGGPEEGGPGQWSVTIGPSGSPDEGVSVPVPARHAESPEERNSDTSTHCSY